MSLTYSSIDFLSRRRKRNGKSLHAALKNALLVCSIDSRFAQSESASISLSTKNLSTAYHTLENGRTGDKTLKQARNGFSHDSTPCNFLKSS